MNKPKCETTAQTITAMNRSLKEGRVELKKGKIEILDDVKWMGNKLSYRLVQLENRLVGMENRLIHLESVIEFYLKPFKDVKDFNQHDA
jgi:hypothetical protein